MNEFIDIIVIYIFSVPSSPSWVQEAQCKYVDNKKYTHSPKEFYSRASSSIGYK